MTKRAVAFLRSPLLAVLLQSLAALSLVPLRAQAATAPERPPISWREGSISASAQTEFFSSDANYDDSRTGFERLPGDNSLSTFESRAKVRYGWSPMVSVFSALGLNYVRALDPLQDKTNSALTDLSFGVSFQAWKRWVRLVPELEVSIPMDKTQPGQTIPITNDGVAYARAGVFLFRQLGRATLDAYLGLHFPTEELAKRLFYNVSLELPIRKGFTFGAGVSGYESVIADDSTYTRRAPTYTSASAGSQRFWAYSPALLEARGWIGLRPSKDLAFRLGYARTINGIRTAAGQSFLLSAVFTLPESDADRNDPGARARTPYQKGLENFDETKPESPTKGAFEADDSSPGSDELDATERLLDDRN